jgi:hypothetical protein
MKAPYLIINGKKATKGQVYWTVSMTDHHMTQCTAGTENNIQTKCYFDNEAEAMAYQAIAKALCVLGPAVRKIEKMHQGDGFRIKLDY